MSAPFDLPDTITVYAPGNVPVYEAIPARVVPCFNPKYYFVCNAGAPMTRYGPTHWVDLDTDYFIPDPFHYDEAFKVKAVEAAWTITLSADGQDLTLEVGYAETRYTNTGSNYQRVWCTRLSRSSG